MLKKLFYALQVVRKRGLGFFYTYFVESVWFDLRHGTKTSARVPKDEQQIASTDTEQDNGLLYVASFTSVTRNTATLARDILGPERFADAQFFDLGCGKGKAMLVYTMQFGASQNHVPVGIEYDPSLAELARANVKKCGLSADRITIVADSAVNLRNYATAPTLVIYLYNSFQGDTLIAVLDALSQVPHVLIYIDPAERFRLDHYGYQIHHDHKGSYNADTWLIASANLTPAA